MLWLVLMFRLAHSTLTDSRWHYPLVVCCTHDSSLFFVFLSLRMVGSFAVHLTPVFSFPFVCFFCCFFLWLSDRLWHRDWLFSFRLAEKFRQFCLWKEGIFFRLQKNRRTCSGKCHGFRLKFISPTIWWGSRICELSWSQLNNWGAIGLHPVYFRTILSFRIA